MRRVVIYSSVYGGYDRPEAQCIKQKPILYTDYTEANGWVVRKTRRPENTPRMRAKYFKCNPHKFLDCDVSIYMDGCGTILTGQFIKRCLEWLGRADIAVFRHPDRDCIYDEAEFCKGFVKYIDVDIQGQVDRYREQGWKEHAGLWACGLIIRRHNERTERFNRLWWKHIREYTYQDQLSFPVCVKQSGVKLRTIELNLLKNNLITFNTPHASIF